jgi:hypothetical protein
VPYRGSPYNHRYLKQRRALLAQGPPCALRLRCTGAPANSADHDPPLALHAHIPGSGCCRLQPACLPCQKTQGKLVAAQLRERRPVVPAPSRRW